MTSIKSGLLGLGDLVDRMCSVHVKISLLEAVVKDKDKYSDETAGKAARIIRKLNKERNTIKTVLNQWSGSGFEEIKFEDLGLLEISKSKDET